MPKTKIEKEEKVVEKKVFDLKSELKQLLLKETPNLFDRTPNITGNVDSLVEKIISLFQ
jgi:hypothetical protein